MDSIQADLHVKGVLKAALLALLKQCVILAWMDIFQTTMFARNVMILANFVMMILMLVTIVALVIISMNSVVVRNAKKIVINAVQQLFALFVHMSFILKRTDLALLVLKFVQNVLDRLLMIVSLVILAFIFHLLLKSALNATLHVSLVMVLIITTVRRALLAITITQIS